MKAEAHSGIAPIVHVHSILTKVRASFPNNFTWNKTSSLLQIEQK